jgi:hypothetical protein
MNNNLIKHSIILLIIIVLIPNVFSSVLACNGGYYFTGITTQGQDWQAAKVYRCNNTFNLTFTGETATGNTSHPYASIYSLENTGATLDPGSQVIVIPINMPQKFKSCNLTAVTFQARANDAVGLFRKQTFSSESDYINSSITNWADDSDHRNCISKTLRPIGKYDLMSYADYPSGHEGNVCKSGNFKDTYINGSKFSIVIQNAGDDGHGFFENPNIAFWYTKSSETCNNIDDDCDGVIDNITATNNCVQLGECAGSFKTCTAGQWSNCSKQPTQEICDGKDNDCDGTIDNGFECAKGSNNCTNDCTFATRTTNYCSGNIPSNAETNYGTTNGMFSQTWNGSTWFPESKSNYYNETPGECAWKCKEGYFNSGGTCTLNARWGNCTGTPPQNAKWNDAGREGKFVQINMSGTWTPSTKAAEYHVESGECKWICSNEYHYSNGTCISSTKTNLCDLTDHGGKLPENAKWNDGGKNGYFNQTWNGSAWLPTTKKALYSEPTVECSFDCKTLTKSCTLDQTIYCGNGTQNCEYGYWGSCTQGNATMCTTNQYCSSTGCQFCADGTKNCDLNLLTGCETNINNDSTNCGTCGNICPAGKICTNGNCVEDTNPQPTDTNLCENVICGLNSNCNLATGNCVCISGYSNCDGNMNNGCETQGSCNTPEEPLNECIDDSDCNNGQTCIDNECITPQTNDCDIDDDCQSNEYCESGQCVGLICSENEVATNHQCACPGETCNESCYIESGICCNNVWNKGINYCGYNTTQIEQTVIQSGNNEAQALLNTAKNTITSGNVIKGQTEAMLAELKAQITLKSRPDLEEKYQQARLALDEANYQESQTLIIEAMDELDETIDYSTIMIIGTIIIILIVVGISYFKFKKTEPIIEENN